MAEKLSPQIDLTGDGRISPQQEPSIKQITPSVGETSRISGEIRSSLELSEIKPSALSRQEEQTVAANSSVPASATPNNPAYRIIDTPVTQEQSAAYRKRMGQMRTWPAVLRRLIPGEGSSTAVDYAATTNYPGPFPYEACYAGPRYWQLITGTEAVRDVLGREKPVIWEFGSATGNLLEVLHDLNPNARLHGVDVMEKASEEARVRVPAATFMVADLNDPKAVEAILGQIKDPPDVFIMLDVLEHLRDKKHRAQLTRDLYDKLKPGGYMVIGMPEIAGESDSFLRRVFKDLWNNADADPTHYHKPTPEEFDELVRNAGFTRIATDMRYFPIPAPIGGITRFSLSPNRLIIAQK